MTLKLKMLAILLFIRLVVFSQGTLPLIPYKGDTLIGITNKQAIEINQVYIQRDRCAEELALEKQHSFDKDSIGQAYRDVIKKMNHTDSLSMIVVKDFRDYGKMKDEKYEAMKKEWKEYADHLNKKNWGIGGGAIAGTVIIILLSIFLHK